jgi:hypothetical protein
MTVAFADTGHRLKISQLTGTLELLDEHDNRDRENTQQM